MNRFFGLPLLLAALWLSTTFAQVAPLPDDSRFDMPVTFVTEMDGESLQVMVDALARSVGLTPIVDSVPATDITINIDEAKPFRQIWNTVLSLYNLDYTLQDNDVVVIGPSAAISSLRGQGTVVADPNAEIVSRFYRVNNNPADVALIIRQAVPGVEVTELASVQSIAVRGTQAQQDEVQGVLGQFDQAGNASPNVLRVYRLSNAKASTLAEVLQSSGVESSIADAEDEEANAFQISEEKSFTVVADDRTNTLVVTAPPEIQAQIADLLPLLDVPQPQVNVQVRIQEVTSRAANNLGINLQAGLGNFAATVLDSGLSFIFDAQTAISGLNLGAVLDTLESQGLSRRVDDGNMTVLNNGSGRMKSGGRIEISFSSANGDIQTRTIEFGVILEITPRISSDGRIIMDVTAEVSDLLTPFNEGGIPQRIDFSERTISSTVTLEAGQTVLLGGLLQSEFSQTETGVPVLSSVPIVGNLFKQSGLEDTSSELLLIVTADVVE